MVCEGADTAGPLQPSVGPASEDLALPERGLEQHVITPVLAGGTARGDLTAGSACPLQVLGQGRTLQRSLEAMTILRARK
jgi:hypothetical protein